VENITNKSKTVLIAGAGEGGLKLLDIFTNDPNYTVVGMVDRKRIKLAIEKCAKLKIPFSIDLRTAILNFSPNLIINVTGDKDLQIELDEKLPDNTELIGGDSARLVWDLVSVKQQNEILKTRIEIGDKSADKFIVGSNPSMKEIAHLVDKVAPTPTSVLVRGETGTGKEVVARSIHRNSHLSRKPFVIINCTALTPSLVESELFGHKKGAFTGAGEDKKGLLERADGGTVFLDEIGDMELEVQAKFLRFLQTGEIRRVGATKSKIIGVRVIAATNRDIETAIQKGQFRGDLFYRFNTFTITIPPLKRRLEDIELFAAHFLKDAVAKVNKQVNQIHPDAVSVLQSYSWPGNLRELKNVIERAVVLCTGSEIMAEALPLNVVSKPPLPKSTESLIQNRNRHLNNYERQLLIYYLKNNKGNIQASAKEAKISRRTFHRLIKKHKIPPKIV
jgi:transcriptional regulator with PAS, ATPase and Fis domain